MPLNKSGHSVGIWIVSFIAIAFGLLTIKSGGSVLFGDNSFREAAGNYVPFVLWFNFLAGFVYIIAGIGLAIRKRWAVWISAFIAGATLIVFAIFGIHVFGGGLYEVRTVVAMSVRTTVWVVITFFVYGKIN